MPRVGFEPTTPVFGRAKTVHVKRNNKDKNLPVLNINRAATVIGYTVHRDRKNIMDDKPSPHILD
jgi:hypothetical protein